MLVKLPQKCVIRTSRVNGEMNHKIGENANDIVDGSNQEETERLAETLTREGERIALQVNGDKIYILTENITRAVECA